MKTKKEKIDDFKNLLQIWKENNQIEYENFTNSIYETNSNEFKKIIKIAESIFPKYVDFLNKQVYKREDIDIELLQEKFILNDSNFLENIFSNNSKIKITPALLYWMYFDYSYEFMVEKMELLRMNDKASFFHKQYASYVIKAIKRKSVKDGLRTKEDWEKHEINIRNILSSNPINVNYDASKPRGRIKESISIDEKYYEFISTYLKNKNTARDIAYLKIALEEIEAVEIGKITAFQEFIIHELKIKNVVHVNGIQKNYSELISEDSKGNYFKDKEDNRNIIEGIKRKLNKI